MPDVAVTETPLQFGESGRLFAILTRPAAAPQAQATAPVFLFLNAGLLHRVGPHRLHVRLARELAGLGFCSVRLDLTGKGDSVAAGASSTDSSLRADFVDVMAVLESHVGPVRVVLAGLCSGADGALKLAPADPRVVGLLLLDPVCERDDGFRVRNLLDKYTTPGRYRTWLRNRIRHWSGADAAGGESLDYLALRQAATPAELRAAIAAIGARRGRVLSVFTSYARPYYNQQGQLGRVVGVEGYAGFCTEHYWPDAEHTFPLAVHQRRLIETVKRWSAAFADAG